MLQGGCLLLIGLNRKRLGVALVCSGVAALVYQFSNAFFGPSKVSVGGPESICQLILFFLPYAVFLTGILLLRGRRPSVDSPERWVRRLPRVIVGGWAAAGGIFIVLILLTLLLGWSEGSTILLDHFLPIMIFLTALMSLTVMRNIR